MNKPKNILFSFLLSGISFVYGQDIKPRELIGLWSFDIGKNGATIEFLDSSRFDIAPESTPKMQDPKKYTLIAKDGETILTLSYYNGGNKWGVLEFLIRESDSDQFKLQIPAESKMGKSIYKWSENDKNNIIYLDRMIRKKSLVN